MKSAVIEKIEKDVLDILLSLTGSQEIPSGLEMNTMLTESPLFFEKTDMMYLFMAVCTKFPQVTFSGNDFCNDGFNSVSNIASIIVSKMKRQCL